MYGFQRHVLLPFINSIPKTPGYGVYFDELRGELK